MRRFKRTGRCHGDVVYLITASWFNRWKAHTGYEVKDCWSDAYGVIIQRRSSSIVQSLALHI